MFSCSIFFTMCAKKRRGKAVKVLRAISQRNTPRTRLPGNWVNVPSYFLVPLEWPGHVAIFSIQTGDPQSFYHAIDAAKCFSLDSDDSLSIRTIGRSKKNHDRLLFQCRKKAPPISPCNRADIFGDFLDREKKTIVQTMAMFAFEKLWLNRKLAKDQQTDIGELKDCRIFRFAEETIATGRREWPLDENKFETNVYFWSSAQGVTGHDSGCEMQVAGESSRFWRKVNDRLRLFLSVHVFV